MKRSEMSRRELPQRLLSCIKKNGSPLGMFPSVLAMAVGSLWLTAPVPASAHDAGPAACKHAECSGGVVEDKVLDTAPRFGKAQLPSAGRVADCPPGYTNNGASCGRGADTISAPSQVASCPSGYTNTGLTCFHGVDTYAKGGTTIFKKFPCKEGYTDDGCFCGRGASSLGASSMTCPSGYFLNASLGRCYKDCPPGYTNTGETCFRTVSTLGISTMTCGAGETRNLARCYPAAGVCPPDSDYYGGFCYTAKCPPGSERTAIATCRHTVKWRANTHLYVVNRALDLLANANDPVANRAVAVMRSSSCQTQWQNGLWDTDDGDLADAPTGSGGVSRRWVPISTMALTEMLLELRPTS